jgi:predicted MFS family arabinose efflux permease
LDSGAGTATTTWTRSRRIAFGTLLAVTMAAATFAFTAFSVLSQSLLDAFDLSRWQLGALVTVMAGAGAVSSPMLGRISDRIGGRGALQLTLGLSTLVLAGIALSPVYLMLIMAALLGGLAQAATNPATNKLIAEHVAGGVRGTVTGIKQSGAQAGVFLGGSLLPLGAMQIGWRPTLLITAMVPALGLLLSRRIVPAGISASDRSAFTGPIAIRSPFLMRLALYGFLIGAGWSALFTYLPDYAQHAAGWSPTAAGLLVSAAGVCGIAGRIGWSWIAARRWGAPATLILLATIGLAAAGAVLLAPRAPALLWLGSAAFGASSGSWNSVGMFAIIDRMPSNASGAASGLVMFGYLVGMAAGAPPFGWAVDRTGTYGAGLIAVLVVHLATLWVATTLRTAPPAAGEIVS